MKKYLLLSLTCCPILCFSQKEDYNWIMGLGLYDLPDSMYKLNHIQFSNDTFKSDLLYKGIPFFGSQATISDAEGNLVCYTNDINLYNHTHQIVENGDNFQSLAQFPQGYFLNQGVTILPLPDTQGVYIMIDGSQKDIGTDIITERLRYSITDMSLNNALGKVTQKKITIENTSDTINAGFLNPVRHGNGKDWWLLGVKYETNRLRKHLITSEGVHFHDEQVIGEPVRNGIGFAAYSPSGEWYGRYVLSGTATNPKTGFYLYRFDRCTGQLSSPIHKAYQPPEYYGGLAFSPNSRFLYIAKHTKIYQYDLEAGDILASEHLVAEYDGFLDEQGVPTRFYGLQLAPDNKIYGIVAGFNTRYLHVIDQPDLPGDSCNVIQHGVYLPAHNFGTLPNMPNFRLYATDTPCDSMVSTSYPHRPPDINMRLMPNPADERLLVNFGQIFPEGSHLIFSEITGKVVFEKAIGGMREINLDVAAIQPGVYLITIHSSSFTPLSIKAVISH